MKKKNLAQEYATARLQGRLSGHEVSFSDNKVVCSCCGWS